ncbi:MAG: 50S ribosomal protein L11 methyltransferase [Clostridia bacterium]|nr:50S ribosomal protein L11 methyltransferase [Clostridia bacterium]
MEWIKVTIFTSSAGIDFVCDMLSELGITGVEIEDEQDFTQFLEQNHKYWDYVDDELMQQKKKETCVKIYLENNDTLTENLVALKSALTSLAKNDTTGEWGRLEFDTEGINEEDWANNWKKYFHPIEVGSKILIQPEWEPLDGSTERIVFTVNPGMTFGTGTHHTTKLCIEELEKYITPSTELLDIGCGSGILSVISLLLGAKEAWALDIDPACEHVAFENATLNGVDTSKYHIYSGDITSDKALFDTLSVRKYDVIVANIVADVIIAILPVVRKLIKDGGIFVCSGIIEERLPDVLEAMESKSITVCHKSMAGGWVAMSCLIQ